MEDKIVIGILSFVAVIGFILLLSVPICFFLNIHAESVKEETINTLCQQGQGRYDFCVPVYIYLKKNKI